MDIIVIIYDYVCIQHELITVNRKWVCFQCSYHSIMFELNNNNNIYGLCNKCLSFLLLIYIVIHEIIMSVQYIFLSSNVH